MTPFSREYINARQALNRKRQRIKAYADDVVAQITPVFSPYGTVRDGALFQPAGMGATLSLSEETMASDQDRDKPKNEEAAWSNLLRSIPSRIQEAAHDVNLRSEEVKRRVKERQERIRGSSRGPRGKPGP